jgi:putative endonuclease
MFWVYAISSLRRNYVYVGITDDLQRRIQQHQLGYNRTTAPYAPFQLIYQEEFPTRMDARRKEKYLKTTAGRNFLKSLQG